MINKNEHDQNYSTVMKYNIPLSICLFEQSDLEKEKVNTHIITIIFIRILAWRLEE